ncbi:MAG: aminomethyl-transferring glycine dehydrogenase subunit GcvPA [Candidatus Caldarchaeum sp.]|uniref:Aminomethyl-transferring glycine dehydrogenase subunit GcvPA n=1 Tax=Caldiarchaeum subterraneum TaxID=311458 RepID=A0A7C4E1X7_CALS0|nr:aminomethyl-transferring glycine dehydrogenase subunit GcvPA [Candidatus Caldarchaeales archaeon]
MDKVIAYIGHHTDEDLRQMLQAIGVKNIMDLYSDIPSKYILSSPPGVEGPLSEPELIKHVKNILAKNRQGLRLFLGGGVWPHHVPAAVKEIVSRSEFVTSYTPYQPEISQGVLTALFEFQSLVADLYEIDAVNSSMYDWATAVGEAFRMAYRYNGRNKIVYAGHCGPGRIRVAETYVKPLGLRLVKASFDDRGRVDEESLKTLVDHETSAVYVENPCYLGAVVENVEAVGEITHDRNALFIVGAEPTSLGLLRPPGALGADIVVGEGQPLGLPMNFGGPLLGILGCRDDRKLIHSMPGRMVGMAETLGDKRRAFTMVLRAREQDIKREKATSNICTNQALCAITAAAYLSLLGKHGLQSLARHIFEKTAFFIEALQKVDGVKAPLLNAPHYMEFTYRKEGHSSEKLLTKLLSIGIVGGIRIREDFPQLGDGVLICVTEVHSVEDIREYVETVKEVV